LSRVSWVLAKVVVANVTVCILLPWNDGLPADVAHERTAPAGHLVAAFGFCETCAAFITRALHCFGHLFFNLPPGNRGIR